MTTLRKFKLLTILAFVFAISANAQNCNCETAFAWVKQTFEENDAGFQFVIDRRGEQAYAIHNQLIAERIKTATNNQECAEIMADWLRFFRKLHIGVFVLEEDEDKHSIVSDIFEYNFEPPYLKRLNETTLYFRIPSFMSVSAVDSVINTGGNTDKILSTENLIIDLRGNGGGSDASWQRLMLFLATNPVRVNSVYFLSTELTNQSFRNRGVEELADRLDNHLGEFVLLHNERFPTVNVGNHHGNPTQVGIIVDRYVGSASESFLHLARQSRKVKVFGEPTAGAFDFSNMNIVESPCGNFALFYATSKSASVNEFPIDGVGFQPDFFLGGIPDYEWVDFVNDILNHR